jgi:hypothetical protein
MIGHSRARAILVSLLFAAAATRGAADQTAPGRDPAQPIDEDYTRKIREYTTEPFFTSPLVDYLPASKTVPTPKAVLGDVAGAPGILPYSKQVYEYMRMLEKASPRVKVFSIGTTEEGREHIAVAIASESLIAKLDENIARLASLAGPRTIEMNDAQAERLVSVSSADLLHHGSDLLAGNGLTNGADGTRVPARGGRKPVHPGDQKRHRHAHHADRRSGRTRSHGGSLQMAPRASERHLSAVALLGQVRRA